MSQKSPLDVKDERHDVGLERYVWDVELTPKKGHLMSSKDDLDQEDPVEDPSISIDLKDIEIAHTDVTKKEMLTRNRTWVWRV